MSARLLSFLALAAPAFAQENVLVLVADDVGVDRIGAFREHPDPGRTPNIDRLALSGVLFRNAWVSPMCSPTRANVLTGRFGFRTGIGDTISGTGNGLSLDPAEWILPELLDRSPYGAYTNAALGKWHLASNSFGPTHPLATGFQTHAGSQRNIGNYFQWPKAVNGVVSTVAVYATSDLADDAIRTIAGASEPWFVWVAFNASHKPFHVPPDDLHSYALAGPPNETPVEHMKAMTEAMDTEIGRLLDNIDPEVLERTTIIFLGDNGTHGQATDAPFSPLHAKGTIFERGVNVPLIIAGPRVEQPGSVCEALVSATDLFTTIAEIGGVDPASVIPPTTILDSVSLLPYLEDPHRSSLRDWVYAERFFPNGSGPYIYRLRTVRGPRFKLMRIQSQQMITEQFFDLDTDPWEEDNLLGQPLDERARRAYLELTAALEGLSGP